MAKTRTDGGVDAPRRKRLEALREDCRRHDQCAVEIALVEVVGASIPEAAHLFERRFSERWCTRALQDGRSIEMALWGAEDKAAKNAVAYLARLGRELAEMLVPSIRDFPDREYLAMFELASRAPSRKSWVPSTVPPQFPPMPEADYIQNEGEMKRRIEEGWKAAGFIERIERKVPDVRAAVAELCDELLEVKPSAERRRRAKKVGYLAWLGIATDFEKRNGRKPQGKEMASMLGMHPSTFSRGIGRTEKWKNYAAPAVRDPKREPTK